ncbi:MAG TPA: phosphotransferase [Pyrinomonadaceae bacterium]|nr:phosphotransferase [Pyrinomonadaceae bacterium]
MPTLALERSQQWQLKELRGHSGCQVFLCERGDTRFVKKIAGAPADLPRLEQQMIKQREFEHRCIRKPSIYESGTENDRFYFTMQYINGVQLSTFISRNTLRALDPIIDQLLRFVRSNIGEVTADIGDLLSEKLSRISSGNRVRIDKFVEYCLAFDWSAIPTGYCHGDLSFENILIHESNLYFIDFLDSFVETPYLDLSKLLLDIIVLWSWRHEKRRPIIKNAHIYDLVLSQMDSREVAIVRRLLILNLLQILPYANANGNARFVQDALEHLAVKFNI